MPPRFKEYHKDISRFKIISQEEEAVLGKRILKGDIEAANKLVEANLKFAVYIALRFQRLRLPVNDLIGYANLGLIHASRKFDYRKGFRFLTYAYYHIIKAIMDGAAGDSDIIRVPRTRYYKSPWLKGRVAKIKKHTGEKDEAKIIEDIKRDSSFTFISLDAPLLKFDGINENSLRILNSKKVSFDGFRKDLKYQELQKAVERVINKLSHLEQGLIRILFFSGEFIDVISAGAKLGLSRSKAFRIKDRALKKLKRWFSEDLNG